MEFWCVVSRQFMNFALRVRLSILTLRATYYHTRVVIRMVGGKAGAACDLSASTQKAYSSDNVQAKLLVCQRGGLPLRIASCEGALIMRLPTFCYLLKFLGLANALAIQKDSIPKVHCSVTKVFAILQYVQTPPLPPQIPPLLFWVRLRLRQLLVDLRDFFFQSGFHGVAE